MKLCHQLLSFAFIQDNIVLHVEDKEGILQELHNSVLYKGNSQK